MNWRENMGNNHLARHVVVHGRVQGVGYRAWTAQRALLLGVEGWVRNRRDGSVEAMFTGPAHTVRMMLDACRNGPPAAQVDAVDECDAEAHHLAQRRPGELFSLLPTI